MKNINQIKQDLNVLLRFYLEKRAHNRNRATMPVLNFVKFEDNMGAGTLILGGFFVGVMSILLSPSVPFAVIGYEIFGHTHKARVQPIEKLLSSLCEIEVAKDQGQSVYRQKLNNVRATLPKIRQEIIAFPSESKQYRQLVLATDDIDRYIQSRLNTLDSQNTEIMLKNGCRLLGSGKTYQFGAPVNRLICAFLEP